MPQAKIHCVVMGEGEERSRLEDHIKRLHLENHISLVGFVADAYTYLLGLDIFALSSVKEGLPYALMEAMAAGLPVVASRVGGIPDLIDQNKNGRLSPPKNAHALRKNLGDLLFSASDRHNFGVQAAQTITTHYSLSQMIAKTGALYHELTPSHQ